MRFLVTNDDGIDAEGIRTLEQAAVKWGEVTVVAPHRAYSGCGHQTTTDRPIRLHNSNGHRHAIDGTPADCVRVGLLALADEADWTLSGINHGGNMGVDVFMSGTVAAVREAALLGNPAIAFSQYRRNGSDYDWPTAARFVDLVLEKLLPRPPSSGAFWNVNLPDLEDSDPPPEIVFCPLELAHVPVQLELVDGSYHYRGDYHARPRQPGSDVDACFSGRIAVTEIRLGYEK